MIFPIQLLFLRIWSYIFLESFLKERNLNVFEYEQSIKFSGQFCYNISSFELNKSMLIQIYKSFSPKRQKQLRLFI